VNTHTTSVAPVPNGASETLEYALDDFSIAQLARAAGERQTYRTFLRRSSSWANLFDTATGLVAPRDADGAFMDTPITDAGQSGFQEGNAAQYTWMVPQDLRDLIAGMGGDAQARQRLDTFFTQLDAGQNLPYAWLGNEPSLDSPWTYLSVGAPWRAQAVVRQALLTLYNNSPVGLPGNDDLGEMSAWYVWCAIGLYPQNPAMRYLDVGSPLFARVVVNAPGGPTIDIDASGAADGAPYVQSLAVNGVPTEKTWLALPMHGNVHLAFTLGTAADQAWGTAAGDAPPSYAFAPVHFPPSSNVHLSLSWLPLRLTIANDGASASRVAWSGDGTSGMVTVSAHGSVTQALPPATASSNAPHFVTARIDATADGVRLEHASIAVRVGDPHARVALAFLENIYDNSVTPIDLATGAMLPKIAVGASPRDGTFADDGLLYITNRDGATITVIDPLTASVVKTIKVGQGPSGITAAPDGTLWFVNAYDGTVQTIDPKTQIASAPIPVGGAGATLRSLAIVGSTAYVTVTSENEVVPIDLRTRALGAPIAVGGEPEGIVASPNGTRLYVVNRGTDDVTPIDVATQRALAPIRVGVAPVNMTVVPNGTTAYVANYGTDTVTPIDLSRGEAEAPIRVGGEPYAIFVSPDGATLWVVNHEDNDLVPIDLATKSVGTPIIDPYGPLTIVLPR
jgi:YVTN family beta-propeller protein